MSKKFIGLFLTLVMLLAAAPSRARASQELTEEQEREARELTVSFLKRLRETDDFAPLVSEFFPADFAQRLKQFIREMPADDAESADRLPCDRALLLRTEDGELRRAYVALMNFWNQQELLHSVAFDYVKVEYKAKGRDASQEYQEAWTRHEVTAEKAVPEEAFRIAAHDPFIEALLRLVRADDGKGDDADSEKAEADKAKFEAAYIRDAARLHLFINNLERIVALLRKAVAKLRSDAKSLAASHAIQEEAAAEEEFKVYHLDEDRLETAAFCLPAGAVVIHARVFPFEIVMTRAEGKLRILAAYPDVDGD